MISTFLMDQLKSVIESGLSYAGEKLIGAEKQRKRKAKLEVELRRLDQKYTGTVIDTDEFQRYMTYHGLNRKIENYVVQLKTMGQSEDEFLRELTEEYEKSFRDAAGREVISGNLRIIYEFLQEIERFCWEMTYGDSDDNGQGVQANQMRHILTIEEQVARLRAQLGGSGAEQVPKSKSAAIFQMKFHKRLFLEKEDGAELAQIYVHPKCRMEFKKREDRSRKNGEPVDAFDIVTEFLKSSRHLLVLEGVAGSGKSSFLAALSESCDTEEYIYLALKDLVKKKNTLDFREKVLDASGLHENDTRRILILDGYDEIHRHLNPDEFCEDLKWFCEREYKIILTTRPGYLMQSELSGIDWERTELQLFDEMQIREWLTRYRQLNPGVKQETIDALMEPPSEQRLDAIRRIPIMLYAMANRNINVHTVSCMGDLYEQVFENLKRDKAGATAEMLESHYSIAQKMAYHMNVKNEQQITSEAAEALSGEEFDKTFYTSVYIENNIIEGKSVMEFVHKSILEFFAAKWIYKSLTDDGKMLSVLMETYISEEILEYLKYFYQSEKVTEKAAAVELCIQNGFERFLENGVLQTAGWLSAEKMTELTSCLFYNFAILQKEMMEMEQFLKRDIAARQGRNLSFIIRSYLLDGIAKPLLGRTILRGENLSPLYDPSYMDFDGMDLSGIAWEQNTLRHLSFREGRLERVIFQSLRIENCDFHYVSLINSSLDKVTFDEASFKGLRMSEVEIMNMEIPRGRLQIEELCRSSLQNVRFAYNNLVRVNFESTRFKQVHFRKTNFRQCKFKNAVLDNVTFSDTNFEQCDFSGVTDRGRCVFERCRIDAQTRRSNPELFEANGVQE